MNTDKNQLQRVGVVLFDYFAEMYFASKLNCKPEAIIEVNCISDHLINLKNCICLVEVSSNK